MPNPSQMPMMPSQAAAPPPPTAEAEMPQGDSALLPKSLLGNVQVGDTITLKVLSIQDQEVEVAPAGQAETPEEPASPYASADAALEAM